MPVRMTLLMDYPNRPQLKIYARVRVLALDDDPALTEQNAVGEYRAKPERVFRIRLAAFDWNCRQHITARYAEHDAFEAIRTLRDRLTRLETENAKLRALFRQHGRAS